MHNELGPACCEGHGVSGAFFWRSVARSVRLVIATTSVSAAGRVEVFEFFGRSAAFGEFVADRRCDERLSPSEALEARRQLRRRQASRLSSRDRQTRRASSDPVSGRIRSGAVPSNQRFAALPRVGWRAAGRRKNAWCGARGRGRRGRFCTRARAGATSPSQQSSSSPASATACMCPWRIGGAPRQLATVNAFLRPPAAVIVGGGARISPLSKLVGLTSSWKAPGKAGRLTTADVFTWGRCEPW